MHRSLLPFTWWKFIGAALAQTGKNVILIKAQHPASQFHHSSQICSFHPSLHWFLKSYRILCLPWSILLLHTGVKPVLKAWQNNLSLNSLEERLTFSSASLYPAASSIAYFKSWRHNSHTPGRGGDMKSCETGTEIFISSYCPLLPYSEVIQEKNFLTWVQELSLVVN